MQFDEQLLGEIAAGDSEALAEFYDRHAPRVLGLLRMWLDTSADADDVLQEVFWQVWRTAERYDPRRGAVVAWLFRIARSRAIDARRRKQSAPGGQGQPLLVEPHDPASGTARVELQHRVRDALSSLPDEQRRALSGAFFAGMTYVEVARHEAIPEGTAKTRIRLALARMRHLLTEPVEREAS